MPSRLRGKITRTANSLTACRLPAGQEGSGRDTEETCTTYNMLKIARYLFRWSGDPRYADYYERAVMNGMLGVQRMPAEYASNMHDHSHGHSHVHAQGHAHTHPAQPGNTAQARSLLGVQLDDGNARCGASIWKPFYAEPFCVAFNWFVTCALLCKVPFLHAVELGEELT